LNRISGCRGTRRSNRFWIIAAEAPILLGGWFCICADIATSIGTALQLANFWQDVRRDIVDRDRIYLPRESIDRFGVSEAQIVRGECDDKYRALLRFEVDRAAELFERGSALLPTLRPSVRMQISLFGKGGRAVLSAIRRQNYDTLSRRPALSKWQKGQLVFSTLAAFAGRLLTGSRR
jgi:phytoene/squalene synthetase